MIGTDYPTRVWQGVEVADPPAMRHDKAALLSMAEQMLQTRRDSFPKEVAAGRVSQREADLEITAFEYLVQNWRFIATGKGEPAGYGADHVLRDALDAAIERIAAFAEKRGEFSKTLEAKVQAVIALRWHLEPGRNPVALARLNHQARAEMAASRPSREPAT